jgi:hypothetical protein
MPNRAIEHDDCRWSVRRSLTVLILVSAASWATVSGIVFLLVR